MSYKATIRPQPQPDQPHDKFRAQVQSLQELFPSWSSDDLQSALAEAGGDIELAAARISEGHAEQWGSVTRKKDKKSSAPTATQSKDSSTGTRGGRGGRGGRGRGGSAARGRGAGGTRASHGHDRSHSVISNGTPSPGQHVSDKRAPAEAIAGPVDTGAPAEQEPGSNSVAASTSASVWGSNMAESWGLTSVSSSAWPTDSSAASTSDAISLNGTTSPPTSQHVPTVAIRPTPPQVAAKTSKVPPGAKLSWAQVARPQEKPSPPVHPIGPSPQPSASSIPQTPAGQPSLIVQEPISQLAPEPSSSAVWEEPTTVQAPTWDDEPSGTKLSRRSTITTEEWEEIHAPTDTEDLSMESIKELERQEPKKTEQMQDAKGAAGGVSPSLVPASQAQVEDPRKAPSTPSRIGVGVGGALKKHKAIVPGQAVVMPVGGNFLKDKGVQFGSLGLGGLLDGESSVPDTSGPEQSEQTSQSQPPVLQTESASIPISNPPSLPLSVGQTPFQALPSQVQAQAQAQVQPATQQTPVLQHALSTSTAQQQQPPQPPQQQQTPLQSYSQAVQPQQPPLHLFAQHGLPHLEQGQAQVSGPTQQAQPQHSPSQQPGQAQAGPAQPSHPTPQLQQQQPQQQQQQQQPQPQQPQQPHSQHQPSQPQQQQPSGNYFRQEPYFHSSTPPQGQDYAAFGQGALGQVTGQAGVGLGHQQHQGVGAGMAGAGHHVGGFGQGDYSYSDGQRGFYDSYGQQGGFGPRNVLGHGHDEVKGLPSGQQIPPGAGLPPAASQSSQQHPTGTQGATQPQPSGGQQYPPPVPYYYPYPQNQYYTSPYNSGYGVPQPFVKYPTMFQGPPGTAPSAAAKQGPGNVQAPSNPYGQSLYGQQHPSAGSYDDLGYAHHAQHGQHQSVGGGLPPGNDYGKQLYGGHPAMQGYGAGPGASGPPRATGGGTSPEAYKAYPQTGGAKDVGPGVGMGPGRGGAGVQQPHAQGAFYGNRFAGTAGAGPQGVQSHQHQGQGQGPQSHLGYGQGAGDGNFYSYPRGQQGYWQ